MWHFVKWTISFLLAKTPSEIRAELRRENLAPTRASENAFALRDSSLKKNTAFVRKIVRTYGKLLRIVCSLKDVHRIEKLDNLWCDFLMNCLNIPFHRKPSAKLNWLRLSMILAHWIYPSTSRKFVKRLLSQSSNWVMFRHSYRLVIIIIIK